MIASSELVVSEKEDRKMLIKTRFFNQVCRVHNIQQTNTNYSHIFKERNVPDTLLRQTHHKGKYCSKL